MYCHILQVIILLKISLRIVDIAYIGDPNTNYGSSVHGNVNYWVNGLGVECCYPLHNSISYSTLPNNLRYGLYGVDNTTTQVNDTISGFTSIVADRDQLVRSIVFEYLPSHLTIIVDCDVLQSRRKFIVHFASSFPEI